MFSGNGECHVIVPVVKNCICLYECAKLWNIDHVKTKVENEYHVFLLTGDTIIMVLVQDNSWTIKEKISILREKKHKKGGQSSARFQANRECQMRDFGNLIDEGIKTIRGPIVVFGNKDMLSIITKRRDIMSRITSWTNMNSALLEESRQMITEMKSRMRDEFLEGIVSDISKFPDHWYIGPEVDNAPSWNMSGDIIIVENPGTDIECFFVSLTGGRAVKSVYPK